MHISELTVPKKIFCVGVVVELRVKGGGEKEGWSEEGAGKGSRGIGESGEGEGRVPQSFVRG